MLDLTTLNSHCTRPFTTYKISITQTWFLDITVSILFRHPSCMTVHLLILDRSFLDTKVVSWWVLLVVKHYMKNIISRMIKGIKRPLVALVGGFWQLYRRSRESSPVWYMANWSYVFVFVCKHMLQGLIDVIRQSGVSFEMHFIICHMLRFSERLI